MGGMQVFKTLEVESLDLALIFSGNSYINSIVSGVILFERL